MLTRYLEQSVGGLLRQQEVMRTEMAKVLESPLAPVANMARENMELWAKMQASMLSAFSPATQPPAASAEPPRSTASASAADEQSADAAAGSSSAGASPGKRPRPRKRRG
jgi:polyhydroxyalkanoate synthesis regulator protein